jgi:hypothetical protein
MSRLIVAFVFFIVGAAAGAYWGSHFSHTAVALRRTRQTICPSVPADTPMKDFPTACRDAMIPVNPSH